MTRVRTPVIVLAGSAGGRLELLTARPARVLAGARVGGTVERSVLARGAVVEEAREASVGEAGGDIALVGLRATVEDRVPAGGRFPDDDED